MRSVAISAACPYGEQMRALSQSPDMIIATPGRLAGSHRTRRINLSHLELFVLDEADRMLDMGFIEDVERISAAVPGRLARPSCLPPPWGDTTRLAKKIDK